MRTSAKFLLVLGLVIETVGFAIDKADAFRFMESIVSPDYAIGLTAVEMLEERRTLALEDPGFNILANIYLEKLREINPPNLIKGIEGIEVSEIRLPEALGFSPSAGVIRRPLEFQLASGQTGEWSLGEMMDALEVIRGKSFTIAAILVFAFGAIIQILGVSSPWRWLKQLLGRSKVEESM